MTCAAVLAVRGGPQAKSRLAGRLGPARREALVEAMLGDMLDALSRCPSLARTYVTTPTPSLARRAARAGAVVVLENGPEGLNGAFARARRRIAALEPDAAILLLPGDLPRLDPMDVEACLAAAAPRRLVVAPAPSDGGTGALVMRAGANLSLAFGPGSFGRHIAAARSVGLEPMIFRAPSLGFDLDRPTDLDAFLRLGGGGRTAGVLAGGRIAA